MERLTELAALKGVEVWELDSDEVNSDEESSEEEEEKVLEDIDEEEEDKEQVVKGHRGLIDVDNPNRGTKAKSEREEPAERVDKNVAKRTAQEKSDLARLKEIRARREQASREQEEKKQKKEIMKVQAKSNFVTRKK